MAAYYISLLLSGLSGVGKNSSREVERVGPFYKQGNGDPLIATAVENETTFVNRETLAHSWKGYRVR